MINDITVNMESTLACSLMHILSLCFHFVPNIIYYFHFFHTEVFLCKIPDPLFIFYSWNYSSRMYFPLMGEWTVSFKSHRIVQKHFIPLLFFYLFSFWTNIIFFPNWCSHGWSLLLHFQLWFYVLVCNCWTSPLFSFIFSFRLSCRISYWNSSIDSLIKTA